MSDEWAGPVSFGDAELVLGWPRYLGEILGENGVTLRLLLQLLKHDDENVCYLVILHELLLWHHQLAAV